MQGKILLLLSLTQLWVHKIKGNHVERYIVFEQKDLEEGDVCLLKDGKTGKCVSFHNCTTLPEAKRKNEKRCSWNLHTPIICCPLSSEEFISGCGRRPTKSSLVLEKQVIESMSKPKNNGKRGFRIVGGEAAKRFSWPWMVSIYSKIPKKFRGGGSIIMENYILTAAHCFPYNDPSNYIILTSGNKNNEGIEHSISDIIIHPGYVSHQHYNDIALAKLNKNIIFNQIVNPICLPSPTDDYTGRKATVIGWGDTTFGGRRSRVLREVTVGIVPNDKCNASYSEFIERPSLSKGINKDLLCAGGSKADACQGDSGGPLMLQSYPSRNWKIIGIVSFGQVCGSNEYPGVYTKVANHLKWIDENTQI